MLGKLFKHEWKASIRVYGLLYILAAIFTVAVILYNQVFKNFAEGLESKWLQGILVSIESVLVIGYVLVLLAVNILTFIYLIYRFYQTMVCDEAYLTHTLPVTTGQLIIVKSVMAFCFQILSIIITIISILSLVMASGEWNAMISEFSHIIQGIKESGFWCGNLAITIILGVLLIIVSSFFGIFTYYMCICAGNLFHSHKLLGSVVVYFIFQFVMNILSVLLVIFGMWTVEKRLKHMGGFTENAYMLDEWISSIQPPEILSFVNSYLFLGFLIIAAGTTILFFVSRYLLKNKLNLA